MPVQKLSVSFPAPLAARIDELAAEAGVSRSCVIQEAAARYVALHDDLQAEQARRDRVDDALARLDAIAAAWGTDERTGVQYLDEVRDENVDQTDVGDVRRG